MQIEFVTYKFKEQNIDEKNIQAMVNDFTKFHKKLVKDYDKSGITRNAILSLIKDLINERRSPESFVLCMAKDTEINKIVGFSIAQRKHVGGTEWHIPATYLEPEYRGKYVGEKRISKAMYETLEKLIREKGGKTINSYVYGGNLASIKSRMNNGFQPKDAVIAMLAVNQKLDELKSHYKNIPIVMEKEI